MVTKRIKMNNAFGLSLLAMVVGLCAGPITAQFQIGGTKAPTAAELVNVKLINFAATVKPGDTFWVGVRFDIDDHWHIYWRHPGDSGEAPRIEWQLPAGWKAGPVHWPVPQRFEMAGDLVNIGYEKQATLLVPITVAGDAEIGSTPQVAGKVHYLICDDKQCLAGDPVNIAAAATIADQTKPADTEQLQAAKQRVPRKTDHHAMVDVRAKGLAGTIHLKDAATPKALFVVPDDDYSVRFVKVEDDGKHRGWQYTVDPLAGVKVDHRKMPAVVVWTDAVGKQHQIEIDLPLSESTK